MLTRDGTHRTTTVVVGSAVVSTGVVAAAVTGSYISSVISICGALLVASIAAATAGWRQKRELIAQHERQHAITLAEDRRQAAEFTHASHVADLADIRSVLDNMTRALQLADEIHRETAAGACPQQDAIRAARLSIKETAITCRLRLGANDSLTMGYAEVQGAFDRLCAPDASTDALLAYSVARERFSEIATERFASRVPPHIQVPVPA